MTEDVDKGNRTEQRSEPRSITDQYHCVEFQIDRTGAFYQFKIWDISNRGICILVKENSAVMNYFKVEDVIEMKYYPTRSSGSIAGIKTRIRHITKSEQGRFKGHYLVGLSIIDKYSTEAKVAGRESHAAGDRSSAQESDLSEKGNG